MLQRLPQAVSTSIAIKFILLIEVEKMVDLLYKVTIKLIKTSYNEQKISNHFINYSLIC